MASKVFGLKSFFFQSLWKPYKIHWLCYSSSIYPLCFTANRTQHSPISKTHTTLLKQMLDLHLICIPTSCILHRTLLTLVGHGRQPLPDTGISNINDNCSFVPAVEVGVSRSVSETITCMAYWFGFLLSLIIASPLVLGILNTTNNV